MPRKGFITASVFNKCMTKSVGKTVLKECCRIACERIGVDGLEEQFDISGLRALEWGIENESLAIAAYEAETFTTVHSRQEFIRVDDMLVGGHPDGLVGDDGMTEIKCPNSDNHLLNITQSSQEVDYFNQIQTYLWAGKRQWCDFISFDPRFPDGLKLYIHRIDRDENTIAAIRSRAIEMEKIISNMVQVACDVRGVPVPEVDVDVSEPPARRPRTNGAVSATLYDPTRGEIPL